MRGSPVMPRCCCRLETRDTPEAFWLSYGEYGLITRWFIPLFMRLSMLLRRESKCEPVSVLSLLSKPWFTGGRVVDGCERPDGNLLDDGVSGTECREGESSGLRSVCSCRPMLETVEESGTCQ